MKISDRLAKGKTFSFEVFPPKADKPLEPLLETLGQLYRFNPDFISCTYGAGGTNAGRSFEICKAILDSGHTVISHFTCIGGSRTDITGTVDKYAAAGIENLLALRGDLPEGWEGTRGDFSHADDLIAFLHEKYPSICLGAAAYPEKHIEAPSFESDMEYLRSKQENGAEFIMCQLCHDAGAFSAYLAQMRRDGITIPVIAGIMPVLLRDATIRMAVTNGCSVPRELAEIIGRHYDSPEDFKKAGKAFTVKQIRRFIDAGVDGIHIYSLNKHEDVSEILLDAGYRRSA
ncbi:MAG: methylenetetrahydrofolate reductase [Clostridiales Family XIII bacterium]|nr:methylenetetrahydrofolate reductase [Clostridiales Family XIII bacterium]